MCSTDYTEQSQFADYYFSIAKERLDYLLYLKMPDLFAVEVVFVNGADDAGFEGQKQYLAKANSIGDVQNTAAMTCFRR